MHTRHYFLDEAGDTTFWGNGRVSVIGQAGVSLSFSIGMVQFNTDINKTRAQIKELQSEIIADRYLNIIPSVAKKIKSKGFYFHATDDPPEIRERFFRYIDTLDCTCEVIVARKIPALFVAKHHANDAEFYADVLSHLLRNKLQMGLSLVLNIAERGSSTRNINLQHALNKATQRVIQNYKQNQGVLLNNTASPISSVVFNVQNHHTEPLLNVVDYMCWSVQRIFERGETRYYDFLGKKINLVVDLYNQSAEERHKIYDSDVYRLTSENKISPPST